jgi:hypothetical protein
MDMQTFRHYRANVADVLRSQGNKVVDRLVFDHLWWLVDDDTLITGIKSAVSYARLAAEISETMTQGKRNRPILFSRDDAINSVRRLVEAGLLLRLSKSREDNLVLQFVQNEVTMKLPSSYHNKSVINQGSYPVQKVISSGEVTTYLPSIHPTKSAGACEHPLGRFRLSLDWKPSEVFKTQINDVWKPAPAVMDVLKAKVLGFAMYWSAQSLELDQAGWELKLWKNELEKLLTAPKGAIAAPAGNVTPFNRARASSPAPKLIAVPEKLFGKVLQDWGVQRGFREMKPGEDDGVYRSFLRRECEKFNLQQERDAMNQGVKREC